VPVNDTLQSLDGSSDSLGESCANGELGGWLAGRAETVVEYRSTC